MTPEQHARDHTRLEAAVALWVADGRPGFHIKNDRGGVKRAHRRTLGLRLQAHIEVHHHATAFGPKGVGRGFTEALAWHTEQHQAEGAA